MMQSSVIFLVWPDAFPRHSASIDFNVDYRRFRFLRPRDPESWVQLHGISQALVLDPFLELSSPRLSPFVAGRPLNVVSGLEECRHALSLLEG